MSKSGRRRQSRPSVRLIRSVASKVFHSREPLAIAVPRRCPGSSNIPAIRANPAITTKVYLAADVGTADTNKILASVIYAAITKYTGIAVANIAKIQLMKAVLTDPDASNQTTVSLQCSGSLVTVSDVGSTSRAASTGLTYSGTIGPTYDDGSAVVFTYSGAASHTLHLAVTLKVYTKPNTSSVLSGSQVRPWPM